MENQEEPVIGYPVNFSHPQSSSQPSAPPLGSDSTAKRDPVTADRVDKIIGSGILILIAVLILGFMFYLGLQIRTIQVHVDSISVSPFEVSASKLTANWTVGFSIKNPSKNTPIYYDTIGASIFYKKEFLSASPISPFYQGIMNETFVQANLYASSLQMKDWVGNAIAHDKIRNGAVDFVVKVQAVARLDPGTKYESKATVIATCGRLKVDFSSVSAGESTFRSPKKCDMDQD